MATVVSVAAIAIVALVAVVLGGGSLPRPGAPKLEPFRMVRDLIRTAASIVGSFRRGNATVEAACSIQAQYAAVELPEDSAQPPLPPKPARRHLTKEASR